MFYETLFNETIKMSYCENCENETPLYSLTQGMCEFCIEDFGPEKLELKFCSVCKKTLTNKEINNKDYNESVYCTSCFNSNTFICDSCKDTLPLDEKSSGVDGVCSICVSNNYRRCNDCEEYFLNDNLDNGLCEDCSRYYYYCDNCGDRIHGDDVYGEDGVLCEDCFDNTKKDRSIIHEHNYKPTPIFHKIKEEKIEDFYGVELEVENKKHSCYNNEVANSLIEDFDKDCSLFYIKEDASLSCGFEVVSHPCSLKFHKEKFPWKDICDELLKFGFYSNNTTTCGLHIHISKKVLTLTERIKLGIFVNTQIERLELFSRRRENSFAVFKKIKKGEIKHVADPWERYEAINWLNRDTIEVRMFRGALKYQTILASIELCHTIVHFIKTISSIKIADKDIAWEEFIKFILGNVKLYKEMVIYMKGKNLI